MAGAGQKLVVEHQLEIGRFLFYPNVIIAEFNEGVHVTFDKIAIPLQLAKEFYKPASPVAYISHRIHSYSNNPLDLRKAIKVFPNFKYAAVVSKKNTVWSMPLVERLFVQVPIRVFGTLESAFSWVEEILEKDSKERK